MNKKKCPICGTEMKIDTSAVCTSIPPKFRCVCPSCNCLDFIETSEYDQYKEEPSLPSNLDEAAEEYGYINWQSEDYHEGASEGLPFDAIGHTANCFKAGAEWMAGQYKTLGETEIYLEDDGGEAPYTQEWLDLATTEFAVPEGFKPGDKVIVQIRKKQ